MTITGVPTPNYTVGREGKTVDKIVCHWIDGDLTAADTVFTQKKFGVSAHFAVEDDQVHQYVKLSDTAWHAGNWGVNLTSVGIEHAGAPNMPITDATYLTSAQLIAMIVTKLGLNLTRSLLHKHNEYYNTQCPGTLDLDRLHNLAMNILSPVDQAIPTGPVVIGVLASASLVKKYSFQYNLSPGMVGEEVGKLQDALIELGVVADIAAVRAGRGTYGPRTTQAVTIFQLNHGIINSGGDYGAGYFGPLTRSVFNNL